MSARRRSAESPAARRQPLRGRHFPIAHNAGFANAVQEAYAEIDAGRKPQAFTVTALSAQRMREIGYDWFGGDEPVLLTRESLDTREHRKRYPYFSDAEWALAAKEIRQGQKWTVDKRNPARRIVWWYVGDQAWVAVVKQARDGGREIFCLSIHKEKRRRVAALQARWERAK